MATFTLVSLLALAVTSKAQNASICSWQAARAAVVRDSWWFDGGLQSRGNWDNNKWQSCQDVANDFAPLWSLNFSTPFDRNTDITTLFTNVKVISEGAAPNYVDGVMYADENEFYTMGGLAYPLPSNTSNFQGIVHGGLYQQNQEATAFSPDWNPYYPINPSSISKYITQGAGANAPSEQLGFYFSGLTAPNGTRIGFIPENSDARPTVLRKNITKVSMDHYNAATFTELALLNDVQPRAGASMVWIPVGSQGALVVIGGVTYPSILYPAGLNSSQQATNQEDGSQFLTNIPVYDVAMNQWFLQTTTGTAPQILSQACAVVATANDSSSHNIYIYGGYDATTDGSLFDSVWILSIPSFKWIKVTDGVPSHGRYAHSCATPYPNQMFVMGGVGSYGSALNTAAVLDVFDLNNLNWTGSYDPENWSEYKVPSLVVSAIGGTETGGATATASPMPSGLSTLLSTSYTKSIPKYYPYTKSVASTAPAASHKSIAGPVAGGVVAGVVVVVITVLMAWCCFCSPRARARKSEKSSDTESPKHNYIRSWMHGTEHHQPTKSIYSSDATEIGETSTHADVAETGFSFYRPQDQVTAAEVDGSSQQGHTRMYSNTSGMSAPNSPGSHTSAELEAPTPPPFLTQLDQPGSRNTDMYRNHPFYPPSIDGQSMPSPQGSERYAHARAPSQSLHSQIAPAELPNKSSENVAVITSRLDLNRSKSDRSVTETSTDISAPTDPDRSQTPDIVASQSQTGARQPAPRSHPPSTLAGLSQQSKNLHSHTSSASSGMAITLSPTSPDTGATVSPGEDQRRSDYIDTLPDHHRSARGVAGIAEESEADIGKSAYRLNNERHGN